MTKTTLWAVTLVCTAAAACGEGATPDGGADATADTSITYDLGADAESSDAGTDADTVDLGSPDMSTVVMCDPIRTTSTCAAGTYCAVVIYAPTTPGGFPRVSYGECVPNWPIDLVEGSNCGSGFRDISSRPGVRADPCGDGLFCGTAASTSSVQHCRRMCDHVSTSCNAAEYCYAENRDPVFVGTCTPTDGCDLLHQTGCHGTQACYAVAGTDGDLYSSCFVFMPPAGGTGAAGSTCTNTVQCAPGTACLNDLLPDGGSSATLTCKTLCDLDPDAGVPDGGATTTCADGQTCTSFSAVLPGAAITFGAVGVCF